VSVRFLAPLPRDQAARVRRFVEEALHELDVELDVPVTTIDRHAPPDGLVLSPTVVAWANRAGVFIARDLLERDDQTVREVVVEEVGHYWLKKACPRVASCELHSQLFATWLTMRICREAMTGELDANDRYRLGRYAGAALAGAHSARDDLRAAGAEHVLRLLDRLDGDGHPRQLAAQLVAELAGR
jgi:hypothetical protein